MVKNVEQVNRRVPLEPLVLADLISASNAATYPVVRNRIISSFQILRVMVDTIRTRDFYQLVVYADQH